MQVLTTDQYLTTAGQVGSDTALSLLALPMFCNAIVLFSFYVLLTKHAWKPLVWCMCIGVLVSVGLNILWIPAHGFVGAIHTSIVVQLLLAVLLFPQALLRLPVRFPLSYVFRLVSFYCFLGLTLSLTGTLATTAVQSAGLLFIGGCGVIALGFVMGLQKVFLVNS